MKTYKWTTIAIAIAASGVVSAAAHSGAQERPSGTSDEITVTGCVRDAAGMSGATSSTTTATTSTTGSPASTTGESYVLANATPGSSDAAARSETATTTTGTTGNGQGSSAAAIGTTYALEGHESDLKKHVGHRIEVTGTTSAKSDKDATTSTSTTTSAGTTTGKGDGAAVGTRLHVSSIRMISADCSRSGQ